MPIREFFSENLRPVLFDWSKVSGYSKINVELGCGVGLHPITQALRDSQSAWVAIERTHEKFEKMERRIAAHPPMANLWGVHANAENFVASVIPPLSVDAYWLLYPNLYLKKKQWNLRWHRSSFAQKLIETLKPDGKIHLATNHFDYAEEAKQFWSDVWKLEMVSDQTVIKEDIEKGYKPKTHFEKKYLLRGMPCRHLSFLSHAVLGQSRAAIS